MQDRTNAYMADLGHLLAATRASTAHAPLPLDEAVDAAVNVVLTVKDDGGRVMFVGNGGSAGIASHMAIDFLRNGGVAALSFNDGASLTCLANDLGYQNVFARPIEMHARPGDLVVAVSSSGQSANIVRAVEAARNRECRVISLSGFKPDNPLRSMGDLNFYVPSEQYGYVEISHLTILHCILDLAMGLKPGAAAAGANAILMGAK